MNRLRMEHRASLSAAECEIERIEARRKKLIEMVMEGVAPSVVKDELNANAARRAQLEAKLGTTEEPPPLLHPAMARIYRTKVRGLAKALQVPESPVLLIVPEPIQETPRDPQPLHGVADQAGDLLVAVRREPPRRPFAPFVLLRNPSGKFNKHLV